MLRDKGLHIITGATGAIGGAIARALVEQGRHVVLACRNTERAQELAKQLEASCGAAKVTVVRLDLESGSSVQEFVAAVRALSLPVAALFNNAGMMPRYGKATDGGVDATTRVNFLNTVALTEQLLPLMQRGSAVIFTTSVTRFITRVKKHFPEERHFTQFGTYGRSKRALAIYAAHLAEELKERGVRVACSDPGVVNSEIIRLDRWFDRLADVIFRPLITSPRGGAIPALRAYESEKTGVTFTQKCCFPCLRAMGVSASETEATLNAVK